MTAQVETLEAGKARVVRGDRAITLERVGKKRWVGTADWDPDLTVPAATSRQGAVKAAEALLESIAPTPTDAAADAAAQQDAPAKRQRKEREPFQAKSAQVLAGGTAKVRLPRKYTEHYESEHGEVAGVLSRKGQIVLVELGVEDAQNLRSKAAEFAADPGGDKNLRRSAQYVVEVLDAVAARAGWTL